MRRITRDVGACFFFFWVGIMFSLSSLKYGHGTFANPGAGFLGFWSGLLISILSAVGFFSSWRTGGANRRELSIRALLGPYWFASLTILLTLIGYALFLELLGFPICTFFLLVILIRILQPIHWKKVMVIALVVTLASYFVFKVWLKTQLPMGILHFAS